MKSMTGYGRGTALSAGITVAVEISAVNGKKRDLRLSLPAELSHLEGFARDTLNQVVDRGSVNCTVCCDLTGDGQRQRYQLDAGAAAQLLCELRRVAEENGLMASAIDAAQVLRVPGIVTISQQPLPTDVAQPVLAEALHAAIAAFDATRIAEGEALRRDLLNRTLAMAEIVSEIDAQKDHAIIHYRDRLQERIALLGLDLKIDDERLAREVVFAAQRSDITEELVRLQSHLEQFREILHNAEPTAGRRLQFLSQEIQREINTLGSKASETALATLALAFKTEVEKVREQILNLE